MTSRHGHETAPEHIPVAAEVLNDDALAWRREKVFLRGLEVATTRPT